MLAFPLLRLLLTRYAPDGRQQTSPPDYAVCLGLLEETLTQIRYSVERNRPTAVAMAAPTRALRIFPQGDPGGGPGGPVSAPGR